MSLNNRIINICDKCTCRYMQFFMCISCVCLNCVYCFVIYNFVVCNSLVLQVSTISGSDVCDELILLAFVSFQKYFDNHLHM